MNKKGIMNKKRIRAAVFGKKAVIAALSITALMFTACGKQDDGPTKEYIENESMTYAQLAKSEAARFSNEDLVFDNVKAGMSPDEVKALLGEPDNDSMSPANANPERVFEYNRESGKSRLIFWETEGAMKLCGVECNDTARVFSRNTAVGMNADTVRDLFYRDENCLNANVMSEDNATILGKFLYGDRTFDRLEENKIKNEIEYGIINYNGNNELEDGGSILEYMSLKPPYKGEFASYNDDYSQIMYYTDSDNKVIRICWYYYPEIS